MRAVFALVLVFGLALAGLAVYMTQNLMSQSQNELARAQAYFDKTGRLVEVYAVAKPLKFGDPITKTDVKVVYAQEKALPSGAFRVPPQTASGTTAAPEGSKPLPLLFPPNADKPRFVTRSMVENEIVLASRVTEPGSVAGLTDKIAPGMRAFQIKVDVASGVAGFVMPDDLIDVYWTGSADGDGEVTRLIEAAVRVMAVDQSSDESEVNKNEMARTVTVAVTPEQVARLAQAQATGRMSMSLIGRGTEETADLVQVDKNALLGIDRKEVVKTEAPEVCFVKTRKGAEVVDIQIPCND